MKRIVEIRTYRLKPGSGPEFHRLVTTHSLPLLREVNMEVVGFGPSLHDPDGYFLIRAFDSLEHLRGSEERFYSSPAWREGPREAIVSLIESDLDAVMWLTPEAIEAMRAALGGA